MLSDNHYEADDSEEEAFEDLLMAGLLCAAVMLKEKPRAPPRKRVRVASLWDHRLKVMDSHEFEEYMPIPKDLFECILERIRPRLLR